MPITLPETLPAYAVLSREGVMVMSPERAQAQEIRPLRIGLLNLMPRKIQTENQFARLIGAGAELSVMIPYAAAIIPMITSFAGVLIYREAASPTKIVLLIVACVIIGLAGRS